MSVIYQRGGPLFAIMFGSEINRLTQEQILHDWQTKIYFAVQVHFKNPAVARKITGMLLENRGLHPLLKQIVADHYRFMNPTMTNTNTDLQGLERRVARFGEILAEAGEELVRSRARPYVVPGSNGTLRLRTNAYNEGVRSARRNTVRAPRTTSPPSPAESPRGPRSTSPTRAPVPHKPAKSPLESATNVFTNALKAHGPESQQAIRARVEFAKRVIDDAQARGNAKQLGEAKKLLSTSASDALRTYGPTSPLTIWATIQYAVILHSVYDNIDGAYKAAAKAYEWSEAGLDAKDDLRKSVFKMYADLLFEHGLATNNRAQLKEAAELYRRFGIRYKPKGTEFANIKDHLAAIGQELLIMNSGK